ncbi:MAG: response regulator [Candidatus Binatia bacterium]
MKQRILVVEDNEDLQEVLHRGLEFLGYEVTKAKTGAVAVQMATSEPLPDLVIMDIILPKMSGLEAAREIRKNPKTKDLPILAATAKAMPGDRERCLASGFDGYIAKPFTFQELGAAIKRLLTPIRKKKGG